MSTVTPRRHRRSKGRGKNPRRTVNLNAEEIDEREGGFRKWKRRMESWERDMLERYQGERKYIRRMMLHLFQQQLPPSFPPPVCLQLPTRETTPTVTKKKESQQRENNLPVPSRLERYRVNRFAVNPDGLSESSARFSTAYKPPAFYFHFILLFIYFLLFFFADVIAFIGRSGLIGDIVCVPAICWPR